jgi:hypothetical protein
MEERILLAQGESITEIPRKDWEAGLAAVPAHVAEGLAFMTGDHHRVRDFVVRELPRAGAPLTPVFIARGLGLEEAQVIPLLEELERHRTFLFRNPAGAVAWAYPLTVDETPHRVSFSTGERLYAA